MAKRRNISGRTLRQASPTNAAAEFVAPRTSTEGLSVANIFGDIGDAIHPGITAKIEDDLGLRDYTDDEIKLLMALGMLPFAGKIAKAGVKGVKALNKASVLPAKGGFILADPKRANKTAERSMFTPKDPNKKPIELSHTPINDDEELNAAQQILDELDTYDYGDPWKGGGARVLPEDEKPFYGWNYSETVDLPELKDYADNWIGNNGTGYNEMVDELVNQGDTHFKKFKLDLSDVNRYDQAGNKLRPAIQQADYNDIVIGTTPEKSAQDLAREIESGRLTPTDYQLYRLMDAPDDRTFEDIMIDYINNHSYGMTQQDLKNLLKTYSIEDVFNSMDPELRSIFKQMNAQIKAHPEAADEIRKAYREQIKALEAINDLDKAAEDPMSALADRYNEI